MAKRGPKGPSKYTAKFIDKEAEALIQYAEKCPLIPFETDFASKRGYSRQRLPEFAEASEKFSDALSRMKDIQEYRIVIGALGFKLNAQFAIFTLKNVAGWREPEFLGGRQPGITLTQLVQIVNGNDNDKQKKAEAGKRFDREML